MCNPGIAVKQPIAASQIPLTDRPTIRTPARASQGERGITRNRSVSHRGGRGEQSGDVIDAGGERRAEEDM